MQKQYEFGMCSRDLRFKIKISGTISKPTYQGCQLDFNYSVSKKHLGNKENKAVETGASKIFFNGELVEGEILGMSKLDKKVRNFCISRLEDI